MNKPIAPFDPHERDASNDMYHWFLELALNPNSNEILMQVPKIDHTHRSKRLAHPNRMTLWVYSLKLSIKS